MERKVRKQRRGLEKEERGEGNIGGVRDGGKEGEVRGQKRGERELRL